MVKRNPDSKKFKYLIGIDEAGRGPLAGPVALGVVAIPRAFEKRIQKLFSGIKNSKQLSPAKREHWYRLMLVAKQKGYLDFACAYSSAEMIDRHGIVWAIRSALRRALKKLEKSKGHSVSGILPGESRVLLDGSLKAPLEYKNQETIIKGDEKVMIIAMASVVAKVRRDRLIHRLAKSYPGYGLEQHVGYGTSVHYRALRRLGPSPLHRRSFLRSTAR